MVFVGIYKKKQEMYMRKNSTHAIGIYPVCVWKRDQHVVKVCVLYEFVCVCGGGGTATCGPP